MFFHGERTFVKVRANTRRALSLESDIELLRLGLKCLHLFLSRLHRAPLHTHTHTHTFKQHYTVCINLAYCAYHATA